jgi:L-ribulose-5-phosphate 3-epimerase UlaE
VRRGIFQGAFPVGLCLPDCFRQARAAGFEGVELSLETSDALMPEAVNETTQAIRDMSKALG